MEDLSIIRKEQQNQQYNFFNTKNIRQINQQNQPSFNNLYEVQNCQEQTFNLNNIQKIKKQNVDEKSPIKGQSIVVKNYLDLQQKNYFYLQQQSLSLKNNYKTIKQINKLLKITKSQTLLQQTKVKAQYDLIIKQKICIITDLNLQIQLSQNNNIHSNSFISQPTNIKQKQNSLIFQNQFLNQTSSPIINSNILSNNFFLKNKKPISLDLLNSFNILLSKNQFVSKTLEKQEKQLLNTVQSSNSIKFRYNQNNQVLQHLKKIKNDLKQKVSELKKKKLQIATSFASLNQKHNCLEIKQSKAFSKNNELHKSSLNNQMFNQVLNFINQEQSKIMQKPNVLNYKNQNQSQYKTEKQNLKTNLETASILTYKTKKNKELNNFSHSHLKDDLKQELYVIKLTQNLQKLKQKRKKQKTQNKKLIKLYEKDISRIQNMKNHICKMKHNKQKDKQNINLVQVKQKLRKNFLDLNIKIKLNKQQSYQGQQSKCL